jgi:hypothetical protein
MAQLYLKAVIVVWLFLLLPACSGENARGPEGWRQAVKPRSLLTGNRAFSTLAYTDCFES